MRTFLMRRSQVTPASWFPNWPTMNALILQGAVSQHLLDATQHDKLADHEVYCVQGMNPTEGRLVSRRTNMLAIRALQAGKPMQTRFGLYMSVQQARKVLADSNMDVQFNLINSPTEGNPNWWLRRVNGAQIDAPFNALIFWMCNIARGAGLNSLLETYAQAYWRKWVALLNPSDTDHNLLELLSVFFQDDVHPRMQTPMRSGSTSTVLGPVVTDPDFEQNGVAENITDFGAGPTAGCRKWSEGILDFITWMEAHAPGRLWYGNSGEVGTHYYDGDGTPPLPMSGHPLYGRIPMGLQENACQFGLGIERGTSSYDYSGGGSLLHLSRLLAIHQLMLRPDVQSPAGRCAVIVHVATIDRTPVDADYEYARLAFCVALLNERCGLSLTINAERPLSLNESLLELGDPLSARSLGTLNQNTAGFTQRAADFISGVARFYWVRTAKALILLRGDSPTVGVWPSADAAIACTLPPPGVGMKYQRINEVYTNPLTGRSMRPQQPALNNGADIVGGLSPPMKPCHGLVLRVVPS